MTDLSPAAQAILDAYGDFEAANTDAMAAALRAAAYELSYGHGSSQRNSVPIICEDDLLAIAAELENQ
jgi:hypothetical protein